MNRMGFAALACAGFCNLAAAGESSSVYTDLDLEEDCTVFASAEEGEGDWANLVCSGYRGYPVFIYSGDLRESTFYGFPPGGDLAPAWESFSAFNSIGSRIEWSRRGISPAATTSAWWSAVPCRISAAARTDHDFFARSIASMIIFFARAESYQPPILTLLPGSRSL